MHGKPDSMEHEPCGFLGHAKGAGNFIGTDSVLAVGNQPHGREPDLKGDRRILENCSHAQGKLGALMLALALPHAGLLQIGNIIGIALRAANHAIQASSFDHKPAAIVVIAEELCRSRQRFGSMIGVDHGQRGTLVCLV